MKRIPTAFAALCLLCIGTITNSQTGPTYSNASLSGTYVFDSGAIGTANNATETSALVGTFTADGKGNITAGQVDLNAGPSQSQQPLTLTGNYSVGADGRGQLVLSTGSVKVTYSFVLLSSSRGNLVEMSTSETSSGQFQLQSGAASGIAAGSYGLALSGFALSQGKNGATNFNPTDWVGQLAADGNGNLAGHLDANVLGQPQPGLTLTGTVSFTNGRGTGTLDGIPFVFYAADSSTVYAMGTSAITAGTVWQIVGTLQAQQ
jgi:hypothetical protein